MNESKYEKGVMGRQFHGEPQRSTQAPALVCLSLSLINASSPEWTSLTLILPWSKNQCLVMRKVAGLITSKISPPLPLLFSLTLLLLLPANSLTLACSLSKNQEPNRFLTMTLSRTLPAPLSIVPRCVCVFFHNHLKFLHPLTPSSYH